MKYRKRASVGGNLRDLYRLARDLGLSSLIANSSIDDEGSLDITVSDATVAKYGHDGTKHGFLVPVAGGWVTVQEDAQARADAAEAAAKDYADGRYNAAKDYTDTREEAIRTWADNRMDNIGDIITSLTNLYDNLEGRVTNLENH